ncbi:MAG: hypothetical protein JWO06_3999, partial [Bacteroidota bacterium]|nr:hypothetical protein [Bacteroidota bacterium]
PCGGLMLATDGKLYGMTSGYQFWGNSVSGPGSIYCFDINAGIYKTLYTFFGISDGFPFGSLIEHNHLLYGMTSGVPQYSNLLMNGIFNLYQTPLPQINSGNIFSFDPATSAYVNLHSFDSVNGETPDGSLFLADNGKMYGMTSKGGINGLGVIFSFDPLSNTYLKLFDFDGTHGSIPMGDLNQSTNGNLYGTTSSGGLYSYGVIFRFDPLTLIYSVITDFDGTNGGAPLGGGFSLVQTNAVTGFPAPVYNPSINAYPTPANSELTVDIQSIAGQNLSLKITDTDGRTVWTSQPNTVNENSQIKLDISFLESGVYILQAQTGDKIVTQKIIRE